MKLIEARIARRMTIQEVAEKAGVSPSTIANLEKGVNQARRLDTVRKIEAALGVNGRMIEEFWAVLNVEPSDSFWRHVSVTDLESSLAACAQAAEDETMSDDDFWRLFSPAPSPQQSVRKAA